MISGDTYEELYEVLSYMDKPTVMKIPEDILKNIDRKRNINYKTRIDKNDIFNKQNISDETLDLLCYIDYNYWMDENKKDEINRILQDKEQAKREKYNPDDLFKKDNGGITEPDTTIKNEITQYKELKIKKIWHKIIEIFKK